MCVGEFPCALMLLQISKIILMNGLSQEGKGKSFRGTARVDSRNYLNMQLGTLSWQASNWEFWGPRAYLLETDVGNG
ncbi:hypothetical protein V6N11_067238 [Hibiscus sabdariffa]|uniref:Uncharacterized protein n=1 Tax=Hibiscus sabdariffa TaxID=183260 RepID=A0ABR2SQ69_9ROSI